MYIHTHTNASIILKSNLLHGLRWCHIMLFNFDTTKLQSTELCICCNWQLYSKIMVDKLFQLLTPESALWASWSRSLSVNFAPISLKFLV